MNATSELCVGCADRARRARKLAFERHAHEVAERVCRRLTSLRGECRGHDDADTDALTGLPNRAHFLDALQARLQPRNGGTRMFALLVLDLDRFKHVNDALGHEAGDRLLKAVGACLARSVRSGDYVARLGGDEFAVLLEDLNSVAEVGAVALAIAHELAKPQSIHGREVFACASIGIATYPRDGADAGTLFRRADAAMYRAKRSARHVAFYETALETRATEHLQLESELRHAVEHGQFVLHYQPELDAATGRLVAAEALVRWEHPQRGLIGPDRFIPLAEEIGLIGPIGAWVLDTACAQLGAWRAAGHSLRVAINFSAAQLQDRAVADVVARALDRFGLQPDDLVVEITESVCLHDDGGHFHGLDRLKQLGVRLAIDDFGTGYSSLSYLSRMPVDILKVDRSFVCDLATGGSDPAIVRGIVSLAHSLALEVVAEGVETEAQRELLCTMGCDVVQGFLLGRTLPASVFSDRFFG